MSKFYLTVFFALFLISGCANVHQNIENAKTVEKTAYISGKTFKNEQTKASLTISCHEARSLSDHYFGMVSCSFSNDSAYWVRMDNIGVDFDDPRLNKNVFIPVGADLNAWATGIQNIRALDSHNNSIVAAAIGFAGAALMVAGKNSSVRDAGAVAAFGSGAFLSGQNIVNYRRQLQNGSILPRGHLLAGNLIIPPNMFIKRWILFYTPEPDKLPPIYYLNISFKDRKLGRIKEKFVFREETDWSPKSPWQEKARIKFHPDIEDEDYLPSKGRQDDYLPNKGRR